jgi:hypothetical protein
VFTRVETGPQSQWRVSDTLGGFVFDAFGGFVVDAVFNSRVNMEVVMTETKVSPLDLWKRVIVQVKRVIVQK